MGSFHDIDEKHAKWMLDCGYAIPKIKVNQKALKKDLENKSEQPVEENKEVQPKKRGRPKKSDKE